MYAPTKNIDYSKIVFFDFETYCNQSIEVGAYNYTIDYSAEVLILCYKFYGQKTKRWFVLEPGNYPDVPKDLKYAFENGYTFVAHNVFFDYNAWNNILYRTCPKWDMYLKPNQVFDTMALAGVCGLPLGLDNLSKALEVGAKLESGDDLKKTLCAPRKPTKDDPRTRIFNWDLQLQFVDYCIQDVDLLELIWDKLPKLSYKEYIIWYETFLSNCNGINVDRKTAQSVINLSNAIKVTKTKELNEFTNGEIQTGGQVAKFKEYLDKHHNIKIKSLNKDWLEKQLRNKKLDKKIRKLLQYRQWLGKSSFAKFPQLLQKSDENGVLREVQIYCGAHNGRWTSTGMQIHNMLRYKFKQDLKGLAELIKTENVDYFTSCFDKPMDLLSAFIRPCIWSCNTDSIYAADLSQIEARMIMYLADEFDGLEEFRTIDLYKEIASQIFNIPVLDITDEQRFIGKTCILQSGYGAGGKKFCIYVRQKTDIDMDAMGRKMILHRLKTNSLDIDSFGRAFYNAFFVTEKIKQKYKTFIQAYENQGNSVLDKISIDFGIVAGNLIIKAYRDKYPKIPLLWKAYEQTAIEAVVNNEVIEIGKVKFKPQKDYLAVELPSGRELIYWKAYIKSTVDKFGRDRLEFRYFGVDQNTKQYCEQDMYGGKWAENIDSAIARDVIANSICNIREFGFSLLFTVHDEVVGNINPLLGITLDQYIGLITKHPTWLPDYFPLKAEGFLDDRYHKE